MRRGGLTLLEILIAVSLLTAIAILLLVLLNPQKQLKKVYDVQRKRDLNQMTKIFEEYYSDKQNYPNSSEICIDQPVNSGGICSCHVCGLSSSSNSIASYTNKLYCDPDFPRQKYLYQYDCSSTPFWYRVCASLDFPSNNLQSGNYNYGVASTNTSVASCLEYTLDISPFPSISSQPTQISLPTNTPIVSVTIAPSLMPTSFPTSTPSITCSPDPIAKWCYKFGCNNCGTFAHCGLPNICEDSRLFNASCQQECQRP